MMPTAHVRSLTSSVGKYAVLLPGTNWVTSRWPVEHFAAMVKPLRERFGLSTVVAGGPGDHELATKIDGLNLAWQDDAASARGVARGCVARRRQRQWPDAHRLGVGPAVGDNVLGRPTRCTGPHGRLETVINIGLPCSPCYSRRCSHVSCMHWLYPEHVLKLAGAQLASSLK